MVVWVGEVGVGGCCGFVVPWCAACRMAGGRVLVGCVVGICFIVFQVVCCVGPSGWCGLCVWLYVCCVVACWLWI